MKIYFDTCALGRLTDEVSQPRMRAELDAVNLAIDMVIRKECDWISSTALRNELERNPDQDKRRVMLDLLRYVSHTIEPSDAVQARATQLAGIGYGATDAVHLAMAESVGADVLLTTDDRFINRIRRQVGQPKVKVSNPIQWLNEVNHGDSRG